MLSPPAPEVDAAQYNFPVSQPESADLFQHLGERRATAAAAYKRNDTERAAVVTAVLNLEIGSGAVARGVVHRRREKLVVREDIAHVDLSMVIETQNQIGDLRF